MTFYILDDDGDPQPTDVITWAQWFEKANRVVKQTEIAPNVRVSTVFLGIDHSWGLSLPILWETMVFGGPLDQETRRYTTRKYALMGHDIMVTRCRRKLLEDNDGKT